MELWIDELSITVWLTVEVRMLELMMVAPSIELAFARLLRVALLASITLLSINVALIVLPVAVLFLRVLFSRAVELMVL